MSGRVEHGRQLLTNIPRYDRVRLVHLWTAFLVFTAGDLLTTLYGLQNGAVEANPVVSSLLDAHGQPVLVFLKLVFLAVVWVDLKVLPRRYGVALLAGGVVYFTVVFLFNAFVIGALHGFW